MDRLCFVIQPIKAGKFTKRYDDVFKPVIESAGLQPYRVDLDNSVKIPIENIEEKISESTLCFADISEDNPNVWYELGYAFALGKDVVMVCDESRTEFPFDIRHKQIITYKSESVSDFDELKNKIAEKIKAYLQSQKTSQKILETPIKEKGDLQSYEMALLATIIANQIAEEDTVDVSWIQNKMNKAGYNDVAVAVGLRQLKAKKFITTQRDQDFNGNDITICQLTEQGSKFIMDNIESFDLVQPTPKNDFDTSDLPF